MEERFEIEERKIREILEIIKENDPDLHAIVSERIDNVEYNDGDLVYFDPEGETGIKLQGPKPGWVIIWEGIISERCCSCDRESYLEFEDVWSFKNAGWMVTNEGVYCPDCKAKDETICETCGGRILSSETCVVKIKTQGAARPLFFGGNYEIFSRANQNRD